MNRLQGVKSISKHISEYKKKLDDLFSVVDDKVLIEGIDRLILAFKEDKTIYIAGNGGSAATASHIHEDFVFFLRHFGNKRLKVRSLTNNVPFITAISNDIGYEYVFVEQLKDNFVAGDILIVLSASGNSENVIKAVEFVSKEGGTSIAFVGFEGGRLKDVCDISIFTPNPKGDYGPIEDLHLILGHLIINYLATNEDFLRLANK